MVDVMKKILLPAVCAVVCASGAHADSRILATGGASTIEGAAGGGIVPWAVLAGYSSGDEFGSAVYSTQLRVEDYSLDVKGVAVSYNNRFELSYARQNFDLGTLGDALGLPGHRFRQDIFGLKYRIAGDLIFNRMPQITLGLQYRKHLDFAVPTVVGALRDSDDELYLSAAKLWLAAVFDRNAFMNVTGRYSRANQGGLLGFGGDLNDDRELLLEASTGLFVTRKLALGVEYREHPENLGFSKQDAWRDVFVGYFVNKHISLVGAYADLGTVATLPDQKGWYMSLAFAY